MCFTFFYCCHNLETAVFWVMGEEFCGMGYRYNIFN